MRVPVLPAAFAVFLLSAAGAGAQVFPDEDEGPKCGCDEFPFRPAPPCAEKCFLLAVSTGDREVLEGTLDLPPDLATRILEMRRTGGLPERFERLPLSPADRTILEERLQTLDADRGRMLIQSLPSLRIELLQPPVANEIVREPVVRDLREMQERLGPAPMSVVR